MTTKTEIKRWHAEAIGIEGKLEALFEEVSSAVADLPTNTEKQEERAQEWQELADDLERAKDALSDVIGKLGEI